MTKKNIVKIDAEVMYLNVLVVNAQMKVLMARLMSFENLPVPLA